MFGLEFLLGLLVGRVLGLCLWLGLGFMLSILLGLGWFHVRIKVELD